MKKPSLKDVEKELTSKTKVSAVDGESEQKYLRRLSKAVDALPDAVFDKLSTPAQEWQNRALVARRQKEPLDDFEGDDFAYEAEPVVKEDSTKGLKSMSASTALRRMVLAHLGWTKEKCQLEMDKLGIRMNPTLLRIVRGDAKQIVEILREFGWREPRKK